MVPIRFPAWVLLIALTFAVAAHAQTRPAADEFPLRDGDTWVLLGDSITAQHLHTDYLEAYCVARFPAWTLHFRNSGVGGDTIPKALARFDRDVAAFAPTVVSVELGMNDAGGGPGSADAYLTQMGTLLGRIRELGARPVLLTASPVNDGTTAAKLAGHNATLDRYATGLRGLAEREGVPLADQFHALLDLWGRNHGLEETHRLADTLRPAAARPATPRADLLRAWLAAWDASPEAAGGANLGGDPVHPGPAGQLTMAAALLEALHAPGLVSEAALSADGLAHESVGCTITGVEAKDGGLRFDRLDECLPMPIPDDARGGLAVMPRIADLSRWMLTVRGLPPGDYRVLIDGVEVASVAADTLAAGWNMGTLAKGPVAEQGRAILQLLAAKRGVIQAWRAKSAELAGATAEARAAGLKEPTERALAADAKARDAAQPKPHRFEIVPKKGG